MKKLLPILALVLAPLLCAQSQPPPPKASQSQATTGTDNNTYMTPLRTAQAITAQEAGSVTLNGTNHWTGANDFTHVSGVISVNLSAGTALTIGTSYYDTLSADRTLTFSGSPIEGSRISVLFLVSSAPTLTIPSCKRVGQANTTITSLVMTNGVHTLSWEYKNATWLLTDSVPGLVDLTAQVTGMLPTANGGRGTAGTDYAAATSGSSVLKGDGAGGTTAATAGTDYLTKATNQVTFVLTIDALASSMNYTIGLVPASFTITDLYFVHNGTLSSPSVVPTVKYGTDRSSGTAVVTSPSAVTAATTPSHVTSFNNSTPGAGAFIWIETASVSGTVDKFTVVVVGHY